MSRDIPILFTGAMVLAHLANRKTMTRRLLSPRYIKVFGNEQPSFRPSQLLLNAALTEVSSLRCVDSEIWTWQAKAFPHQNADRTTWMARINPEPGTRMWVRERTTILAARDGEIKVSYDADGHAPDAWFPFPDRLKQKPITGQRLSMGCYREISRITNTVKSVKIEPLQDISNEDAEAEGIEYNPKLDPIGPCKWRHYLQKNTGIYPPSSSFETLWKSIHDAGSWDANPFVVAIGYSVQHANIDAPEARAA